VSDSELNIAKLKKIKFPTEEKPHKKFPNKNTKKQSELSTEFCNFFLLCFLYFQYFKYFRHPSIPAFIRGSEHEKPLF
jgi:hypothetical protein